MSNDYFDKQGNRIKLDTRFIEKHGNPNRQHRMTEREGQSIFRGIFGTAMFGFCAWFIFGHCSVLIKEFHTIIEFIGVSACGAYMGLWIEKVLKEFKND